MPVRMDDDDSTEAFKNQLGPLEVTQASPVRLHAPSLDSSVHAPTPPPRALAPTPVPGTMRAVKLPQVPGFVLSGELGRGGMGVVYRAKQIRLNRVVALKMLLHADTADLVDVIRFRSEAEAVAAVKHPHVVQVHEFGHVDGKPYFAMEFLAGGTLHSRIRTQGKSEPLPAAQLVEKLARAVQAAHSEGIVHRDLKPGNILFDEAGEPRVTDFGLAKRFSLQLTNTQAVMGTPAYMSPEQASGRTKFVGPPSDIYSLGVILYECLTGKPPFDGADSITVIHQVLNDTPSSIRSQVRAVPRDLELICLKCLEKNPVDRYSTAEALADDLARYINGKPVLVRPAGPIERGVKWARRRPTMATVYALTALVCFVTILGLGVGGLWQRAEQAKTEVEQARDQLVQQNEVVEAARVNIELSLAGEQKASAQANASAKEAKEARLQVESANLKLETLSYFNNVGFANLEVQRGNVFRARQLLDLCPTSRRDWEWWHIYRTAYEELGSGVSKTNATDCAFERDGFVVTTCDLSGGVNRFDFATGRGPHKRLAPHEVKFHYQSQLSHDATRALTLKTNIGNVVPDAPEPGRAFESDAVTIWDTATGKCVQKIAASGHYGFAAAISGDGQRVVVGYVHPAHAATYDVATGKQLATFKGISPYETSIAMNWDGTKAVTERGDRMVVWDALTGKVLAEYKSKYGFPRTMTLDADGTRAFAGTRSGALMFVDVRTGQATEVEKAHAGTVVALTVSPDGKKLASAGQDGIVRIWNADNGALEQEFRGHTHTVLSLRFDSTGQRLASTDNARQLLVWSMNGTKQARESYELPSTMKGRYFADRGRMRCFAIKNDGSGEFWDVKTGLVTPLPAPPGDTFTAFDFEPKGQRFAVGTNSGKLYVWDVEANDTKLSATFEFPIRDVTFSGDSSRIAATDGYRLDVLNADTRTVVLTKSSHNSAICISDDGRFAAAGMTYSTTVWDLDTKESCECQSFRVMTSLALSPKGETLAMGMEDWNIGLYPVGNAKPGQQVSANRMLVGHTAKITCMNYHPTGHRLVSGAADGSIKVWDPVSQHEAIGLEMGVRVPIQSVCFSIGSDPKTGKDIVITANPSPPFVLHGSPRELMVRSK